MAGGPSDRIEWPTSRAIDGAAAPLEVQSAESDFDQEPDAPRLRQGCGFTLGPFLMNDENDETVVKTARRTTVEETVKEAFRWSIAIGGPTVVVWLRTVSASWTLLDVGLSILASVAGAILILYRRQRKDAARAMSSLVATHHEEMANLESARDATLAARPVVTDFGGRPLAARDRLSLNKWYSELNYIGFKDVNWRMTMPYAPDNAVGRAWNPRVDEVDVDPDPRCPKCETELSEEQTGKQGAEWRWYCVGCGWYRSMRQRMTVFVPDAGKAARSAYRNYLKTNNLIEGVHEPY
jgi:hypothetical protein